MPKPSLAAGPVLASLAAMCLFATAARAQEAPKPWLGFYVGGGGSYSTVSVDVAGGDCYDECYWWGDYDD
jgi:Spy/CpxP family protein refolding chaperone